MFDSAGIIVKCDKCGKDLELKFEEDVECCGITHASHKTPNTLKIILDAMKYKQ